MSKLLVKKLHEHAIVPTKAHPTDAGYDLYASHLMVFQFSAVISTGVAVAIPEGYYGRVASRSGLSFKQGVEVGAGVIDSSYRGEIKVKLYCHDVERLVQINRGDKIAQLIITPCASPEVCEVDQLPGSDRGEAGFGSTGR